MVWGKHDLRVALTQGTANRLVPETKSQVGAPVEHPFEYETRKDMPEAAVDKDNHTPTRKNNVRRTWQSIRVQPEPITSSVSHPA